MDIIGSIDKQIELCNQIRTKLLSTMLFILSSLFKNELTAVKFGSLVKTIGTGLNPRKNFVLNECNSTIPYITIKNITTDGLLDFDCDHVTAEASVKINKRSKMENGDILFTSITPIGISYYVDSYSNQYVINESVFCIKPNTEVIQSHVLYLLIQLPYFRALFTKEKSGSVQKSIKIDNLLNVTALIPSFSILSQYGKETKNMFNEWKSMETKLHLLKKYKSLVLPMLLNEQIN